MNLKNTKSIQLGMKKVHAILMGDRQLYPRCKKTIDEHDKHGINEEALNPLVISDEGIELLWHDIQNIDNICPEVGSIPPIEVDPQVQEAINSLADILFPEDGGDDDNPSTTTYHTITFICDSTKGTMSGTTTQQVEEGHSATPPTISTSVGWSHSGWSSNAWQNVTSDETIHATFNAIEYTISYDLNGHGTLPANATTEYTIQSTPIVPPTLSEEGWTFNGWTPTSIPSGSTGNKTFVASWTQVDVPQENTNVVKNSIGFDVVLKNASTNKEVEVPGKWGGYVDTNVPSGTYTITKGIMSGIDANGTTYAEGDTIPINGDMEMTKHTYALPNNWQEEIDEKYPIPTPVSQEVSPEEPMGDEDDVTKMKLALSDPSDLNFYILGGLVLADDNQPATIDWGDGTTTTITATGQIEHAYPSIGEYTLTIDNTITSILISMPMPQYQSNAEKIVEVCGFGSKVTSIESYCFARCANLESIVLPRNLEYIGKQAFYGCSNLGKIVATGTTPAIANNGNAFAENTSGYECGRNLQNGEKTLTIPNNSTGYEDEGSYWKTVVIDQLGYVVEYLDEEPNELPKTYDISMVDDTEIDQTDYVGQQLASQLIDISNEPGWHVGNRQPTILIDENENEEEE